MKILKIAAPKNLSSCIPVQWKRIEPTDVTNPAEIAGAVCLKDDFYFQQIFQKLQQDSGLSFPVIKVSVPFDVKDIQSQVINAAEKYEQKNIPGFLSDLIKFAKDTPLSFTTPGHHNGQYYEKHPAGVVFDRFFGKNMLTADTSDTVAALGDTMTHTGTPLTAQKVAAQAYHADKVYFCTNGTTSANTICASALLSPGDLVLFDRNNHKSLYNSALVSSGAIPIYVRTDRNPLGLIGAMNPDDLSEKSLREQIKKAAPAKAKAKRPFRLAVVQAETYDGVFYNAEWIIKKIGSLCDYILFDCAWGGYEQFVPLLKELSPLNQHYEPDDPGILVTQSVHKQQAGMGQTSQILKKDHHIKGQSRYVDHKHFNNAYLKYVTSSYSYPIYASLTTNAYLAASEGVSKWWSDLLVRSIEFRKQLLRRSKIFKPLVPLTYENVSWQNIPTEQLATQQKYWQLDKSINWHGFNNTVKDEAMLDPFKLTIVTPGIDIANERYLADGIPGAVVAEFLLEKQIIRGKDDLNSLLFLLTPGDSESDLNTLLDALLEFEKAYEADISLQEALPRLYEKNQERYQGYTLHDLCHEMHEYYKENNTFNLQKALFAKRNLQDYVETPWQADLSFKKNQNELCDLDNIVGQVALEGALPYPPGVFIVAPGEKWQKIDQQYFKVLVGVMENFPGFIPEIQGVYYEKDQQGHYKVQGEVEHKVNEF
ncbi:putative ornithine decarboxylase [Ligilactobacillus acidipiscis]|uniref:Ornithine decarboxylase n=1 Tax=Ligilactobacillus acidipiscis TaxID=89059 RepID=A0A0R2KIT5_9LACO|nr:putative ornithine decarboxylase [Ligilactobacillus acidipiscis]KRN86631.1 ornithine decarboxylase [Ligilactobacillus acidipiscis]SFV39571.1 Ornithine decarboxylase [Ligilactobacillus acidipiscis]